MSTMMNTNFTRRTPLMALSLAVLVVVAVALVLALVSLTAQTPSPVAAQDQQPVYVSFDPNVGMDGSEQITVVRSIPEDTQFAVDVFLSRAAENDLTLRVHTAAGGLSAQPDRLRLTAELTIMAGEEKGTVMLMTAKDDVQGTRPQRAKLDIEIISGDAVRHPDAALLTVAPVDDDTVLLDFAQTQPEMVTVAEGETVTLMVELRDHIRTESTDLTVRFEGGLTGFRTFDLGATVDGPTRDLVMFPLEFEAPDDLIAGTAPDPITVTLFDDANVRLVDTPKQVVVHVRDSNPVAMVSFASSIPSPLNVGENETVTLRVELQQDVVATRAIDVLVNLSGGISGERTVTIATGTNFGLLTFQVPGDDDPGQAPTAVKADLNLPLVGIGNPVYEVVGSVLIDITIVDDDVITVGFDQTSYTFTEGEQVSARVEVQGNISDHVSMSVEVTGIPDPANPGSTQSENVTLSATNRSATITFMAPDDDQARVSPDDVELTIVDIAGVNVAQGAGVATVRFRDNDPLASVGFMGDFRPEVVEGEMVTLEVGLQPGVEATRAIEVRVSGFPSGGPRTVTIPQSARSAPPLTFAAPDDDVINETPDLRLTLEVAGAGDEAQVNPNRDEFRPILHDHELLVAGADPREGTLANFGDSHNWIFEVSGSERQFVILQATGSHPTGSAPARVMGELYAGAVLPNMEGRRRLVAAADDLTRWGSSDDDRHQYFRIERWLEPGTYALVVEVDRDNPSDRSETYQLLADVVMPDANTLTLDQATTREALVRANNDPLRGRSVPYYYRLEVPEDARDTIITIRSMPSNTNSDPVARLLNSEGGFIAESSRLDDDTDGNMFKIERMLEPGTYYLAVQSFVDGTSDSMSGSQLGGNVYSLSDPIEFALRSTKPRLAGFATMNPDVAPENGEIELRVELTDGAGSAAADLTLNVEYAGGGGYTGPTTVTIPANTIAGTLKLSIPGDKVVGTVPPPLTVTLMRPTGNTDVAVSPSVSEVTITLTENDPVARFRLAEGSDRAVVEGNEVTLRVVTVDEVPVTETTEVRVELGDGREVVVQFEQGAISAELKVQTLDNEIAGGRPIDLTVQLVSSSSGAVVPANSRATIRTLDDGDAVAMVSFAPRSSDQQVSESGVVTFVAQLNVEATETVVLQLVFSDGRDPQTVMIPAGARMVEVEVPTTSDELEGTPLTVTIESPDGRVMLDADAPSIATVVYVPVAALLAAEVPVTGGVGLGWGAIAALLAFALALALAGVLLCRHRAERYTRFLR